MKMTLLISRLIISLIIICIAYFALERVWTKKVDLIGWFKKPSEVIPIENEESESVVLQFNSTIFFHKSDKKPLDEHEDRRHAYGGEQFDGRLQDFIRKCIENDENFGKGDFRWQRIKAP